MTAIQPLPPVPESDPVASVAVAGHAADAALDGGPHGLPALTVDGMAWVRVAGALGRVYVASQAALEAEASARSAHAAQTTDAHNLVSLLGGKADLVGGLVATSQLPALAITDVFTVGSQAAMLALAAERGDMAIRSDQNKAYVLNAEPASVLANWKVISTTTANVTSVNGQTGVIVLAAPDVGAAPAARSISAGSGLTGGGDLSADRTLAADFGTAAGKVAQGDDSRLTGAVSRSLVDAKGDLLVGAADDTVARKAVGGNGRVLAADASGADGLTWISPSPDPTRAGVWATPNEMLPFSAFAVAHGVMYITRWVSRVSRTLTNLILMVTAAAAQDDAAELGIFACAAGGAKLASSGVITGKLNALGRRNFALTSPLGVVAHTPYFIALVCAKGAGAAANVAAANTGTWGTLGGGDPWKTGADGTTFDTPSMEFGYAGLGSVALPANLPALLVNNIGPGVVAREY